MFYIKHNITASTSKEIHYQSKVNFESALSDVVRDLLHREVTFQMFYHPTEGTMIQTEHSGNWEAYFVGKESKE